MSDALLRHVEKRMARMLNRMQSMVSRVVVSAVNDALKTQGVSVSLQDDDSADNVEHFQPGGVSHRATAGAEGIYLSIGAENANGIVVCVSKRGARVKASMAGGTVLYAEVGSNADVEIRPDGTGGMKVGLSPEQEMVLGGFLKAWLETHTHTTAMGPSGPPVQVGPTLEATLSAKHKLDA